MTKAKKRAREESTPISDILDSSCMEILGTASLSIKRDPLLQAETHKKWPALPTKVDDFDTNKIPILLKTKDQFLLFDVRQINNNETIRFIDFLIEYHNEQIDDLDLLENEKKNWISI